MKLKRLLNGLNYISIEHFNDIDIEGITSDSRHVKEGFLFVAIEGFQVDGRDFIDNAIERGARGVVVSNKSHLSINRSHRYSESSFASTQEKQITIIQVEDTRKALAQLAGEFYGHPSQHVKVIGITGTNGKTTTSFLTDKILSVAGFSVGLIGTVNYKIAERLIPATNTTPEPTTLQSFLSEMVTKNLDYAVLEVSSHSLDQRRVEGINFTVGVFTNLTHDHLDYHLSQERYFQAKAKLFEMLNATSAAIINIDDSYGAKLIHILKDSSVRIITYGRGEGADIRASKAALKENVSEMEFSVSTPAGSGSVETKLIGLHNVYNILGSIGVGLSQGIDFSTIRTALQQVDYIPGRLERIDCGQPFKVFVDYAHSDDALRNVLQTLRAFAPKGIRVVFGCGGDRDATKRPKMGEVASHLSDYIILTTDNPRSEDPSEIINDIEKGIARNYKNYKVIVDRFAAIEEALSMANDGDTVLIAGKGHETYQTFSDRVVPFDDREVVKKILSSSRWKQTRNK